ncbi:ABC transporter-like protein 12, partial [Dinothrombium tinctorium]
MSEFSENGSTTNLVERNNSSHYIMQPEASDFEICWRNLNYTVKNSMFTRFGRRLQGFRKTPKKRDILRGINGRIRSGELVAFMGPSGAGKSTLLECVVGKRVKGKSGDIKISGDNLKNIKIAFIAQKNNFLTLLTVREAILFATKLQIATKVAEGTIEGVEEINRERGTMIQPGSSEHCSFLVDKVISDLGLDVCANNRISACSGGQLKRLAMAQELVAKPRILVLDEPTSGLDSASCHQVIEILLKLTQQTPRIAVLATIHQPSVKILNKFHKLYVIASNGDCIYEDDPSLLVETLSNYGLICPPLYNPSDYVMEVASGEHGIDAITNLSKAHKARYDEHYQEAANARPLAEVNAATASFPVLSHTWYLFQRNVIITLRDPLVFGLRFASVFIVALFMTSLFGFDIGVRGGCPPQFDADFEPSQLDEIGDEIEEEMIKIYNNTGNWFFVVLFIMFSALMPTCLAFPSEMIVFKTEKENSWYNLPAFFFGKFFAEVPFQMVLITMFLPLTYTLQNQYPEGWRFWSIYVVLTFVQFIAQTLGYITGALFMYNVPASVFLGPTVCIIPFMLVSGIFVKIKSMSPLFASISYFSYLRFAMEGVLVALYGFGRCGDEASQKLVEGKEAFIVWMSAMLGIYKDESETTTLSVNSTDDYVTMGTPSEKFVEELIDTIAGDFISDRNEVRSAIMNIYAMEDWFLTRAITVL